MRNVLHPFSLLAIATLMSSMVVSCSSPESTANPSAQGEAAPQNVEITLVSYAVTRGAFEKIIPKFAEEWQTKTGQTVTIEQSYGGSGSQTRAVIDGLKADIVALALAGDIQKISEAGLIEAGWEAESPRDSMITNSVIAIVPRDPNLKITDWSQLADKSIKVITANPKTSGGAKWNFLGLWSTVAQSGGSEAEALAFVENIYKNVPILPKDARESSDVFYKQGQGDVLLNYENEVILANKEGQNQPYTVLTDKNFAIEGPVAIVDQIVDKRQTREVAEAFVAYLFTPEAQRIFAESGFRPTDPAIAAEFAAEYPPIEQLSTVKDLGGWQEVDSKFFKDGAIFDQILSKIGKS